MAQITELKTKEKSLLISVEPGEAVSIRANDTSSNSLNNASASNNPKSDNERKIASNVIFIAEDKYDNPTLFPENCMIMCSLRFPEDKDLSSQSTDELPDLYGASSGVISGRMLADRKSCIFGNLDLIAGTGSGDSLVEIVFQKCEKSSSSASASNFSPSPTQGRGGFIPDESFNPWIATFTFSTNQGKIDRANNIKASLAPYKETVNQHESIVKDLQIRLDKINRSISQTLGKAKGHELSKLQDKPNMCTQGNLSDINERLTSKKRDMNNSRESRQAKKPANFPNPAKVMIRMILMITMKTMITMMITITMTMMITKTTLM
jgi:hypothetical protein